MHFKPVKVSFDSFDILSKILSANCELDYAAISCTGMLEKEEKFCELTQAEYIFDFLDM